MLLQAEKAPIVVGESPSPSAYLIVIADDTAGFVRSGIAGSVSGIHLVFTKQRDRNGRISRLDRSLGASMIKRSVWKIPGIRQSGGTKFH